MKMFVGVLYGMMGFYMTHMSVNVLRIMWLIRTGKLNEEQASAAMPGLQLKIFFAITAVNGIFMILRTIGG